MSHLREDRQDQFEGPRRYQRATVLGGVELLTAEYRRHFFPPHAQDTVVLGLVERGCVEVRCGERVMEVREGRVLFIPAGVIHEAHALACDPWTYRALYLLPHTWDRLCSASGASSAALEARALDDADVYTTIAVLHAELAAGRASDDQCLNALERVIRHLAAEHRRVPAPVRHPNHGLEEVRRLLDEAPSLRISLAEMADRAGLSRFHFLREFRRAYGVTPHAYAVNRRVMNARQLLLQGRPISMAALESGFADQAHLTRVFLRTMGVTPGEFRRAFDQRSA